MENQERKIEVHVHDGGQFNLAFDNAHIDAVQNNANLVAEAVSHTLLDVIDEQEYIHEIYESGKEQCRLAVEADVKDIPDERIEEFKKQLGARLKGTESKLQIISMLLHEMDETLQTGKRYGILPMFTYIPRGIVQGYIYVDDCAMPYDNVEITQYYWESYEKYVIDTKYYHFLVLLQNGVVIFYEIGYNLSFPDVKERLYGFGKVKVLENAKKLSILLQDEKRKILVNTSFFQGGNMEEQIALTDYWIEQMEMIDTIEEHYKIKFHLPKKASEQDYKMIYAIYNSVKKLQTSTFPAIPEEKVPLRRMFRFNEDVFLSEGENLPHIDLFGYYFKPVAVYLTQCTLIWKKKIRAWEVKEGGLPVRIEFDCYKI